MFLLLLWFDTQNFKIFEIKFKVWTKSICSSSSLPDSATRHRSFNLSVCDRSWPLTSGCGSPVAAGFKKLNLHQSVWWWGAFNSNKLYWHNITWLVNLAVSQHINIPVLSFNPSLSVVLTIQATCIKLGCNYQLCSLMISQFLNESIKMSENSEK